MIGSSDGKQYEDSADHFLDKPVDDNSDSTFKSLSRPITPGTKIRDPQGQGRDVRISDEGFQNPNIPHITINRDYDVKSGSVASKDPSNNTVYISPDIPDKFAPFLAVHEETEKRLMNDGLDYDKAHIHATLAERHAVVASGQDWKTYTDEVDPHVAKAEKGSGANPPPDPHVNIEDSIGHHADKASVLERADMKIASDADTRPQAGQRYAAEDTNRRNTLYNMGVEMSGGKGGGGYSRGGNVQPLVRRPANENEPEEFPAHGDRTQGLTYNAKTEKWEGEWNPLEGQKGQPGSDAYWKQVEQEWAARGQPLEQKPYLEQKPWTSKEGNPWGMSDKDYMQWRGQPKNELAAARWEKNNPTWKGDMAVRTDKADLAKFGVDPNKLNELPPEQVRYIKQAIRQKVDKQFGKGSFDQANALDEKTIQGLRQNPPKSLEEEVKGLNEAFDKTIAQLHKDFPDLPPMPKASPNMSFGEKAAFYGSLAAALGGSAIVGAMKAMGLLDKKPAEDKTLGPRSMSDEQPDPVRPGQQYAMEDTRIRVPPEGPGRPSTGGGSSRAIASENAQASAKFRDAVEIARQGATSEKVDRPAIKVGDEIFEGKPGESHYHVMVNNGKLQKMPGKDMDRMESGWVTNTGRYVSREEAMEIARKSEQIKEYPKRWADDDFSKHELISEDFYGGRGGESPYGSSYDSVNSRSPLGSTMDDKDMASFLKHLDNFIPRVRKKK